MKNFQNKYLNQFKGMSTQEAEEYYLNTKGVYYKRPQTPKVSEIEFSQAEPVHHNKKPFVRASRQREFLDPCNVSTLLSLPRLCYKQNALIEKINLIIVEQSESKNVLTNFRLSIHLLQLNTDNILPLLIDILGMIHRCPSEKLLFLKENIAILLSFITSETRKLQHIPTQLLARLAYYYSKLPIDWHTHEGVLNQMLEFFESMVSNAERRQSEFADSTGLLRNYCLLLGSLPKLPFKTNDLYLHHITLRLFQIINNRYFMSTNTVYVEHITIKYHHLLWQYCVWQFGLSIYERTHHAKRLFNYIESAISKPHNNLPDDVCDTELFKSSHMENNVYDILKAYFSREKLSRQIVVGCYAIDIAMIYKKIAFEINGPYHYFGMGSKALRLHDKFKYRLLAKLGWKVVVIPYFIIQDLKRIDMKTAVLAELQKYSFLKTQTIKSDRYIPPHRRGFSTEYL